MTRRTISIDELDGFEIDANGRLYWQGSTVLLERRITLRGFERAIAFVAATAAVLAAIHPFGVTFGWW